MSTWAVSNDHGAVAVCTSREAAERICAGSNSYFVQELPTWEPMGHVFHLEHLVRTDGVHGSTRAVPLNAYKTPPEPHWWFHQGPATVYEGEYQWITVRHTELAQAEAMLRHLIDLAPSPPGEQYVSLSGVELPTTLTPEEVEGA